MVSKKWSMEINKQEAVKNKRKKIKEESSLYDRVKEREKNENEKERPRE